MPSLCAHAMLLALAGKAEAAAAAAAAKGEKRGSQDKPGSKPASNGTSKPKWKNWSGSRSASDTGNSSSYVTSANGTRHLKKFSPRHVIKKYR